jgi:hypothetical protein
VKARFGAGKACAEPRRGVTLLQKAGRALFVLCRPGRKASLEECDLFLLRRFEHLENNTRVLSIRGRVRIAPWFPGFLLPIPGLIVAFLARGPQLFGLGCEWYSFVRATKRVETGGVGSLYRL